MWGEGSDGMMESVTTKIGESVNLLYTCRFLEDEIRGDQALYACLIPCISANAEL